MKFDFELSAAQAVEKWDSGANLWSIEMGGLGPSYEQSLQVATIEICRHAPNLKFVDLETFRDACKDVSFNGLGLSGGQFAAAVGLAFEFFTRGWAQTLRHALNELKLPDERFIQISKFWPKLHSERRAAFEKRFRERYKESSGGLSLEVALRTASDGEFNAGWNAAIGGHWE